MAYNAHRDYTPSTSGAISPNPTPTMGQNGNGSAGERLTSPRAVRALLRRFGLRPRKRWGQHFLCDENVLLKVLEAAELRPDDRVFEIGPGLGVLTEAVAARVPEGELIAVEIDARLIPLLRERLSRFPHVKLVHGDALELDWTALFPPQIQAKALGNLPYGITAPLLEKFVRSRGRFERAVWMVQLEVAQKLTAPPGTRGASALGVFVQAFCDVERLFRVSRRSFWPPPEVDSAVVRLTPLSEPRFSAPEGAFLRVVRAAFAHRRKTLLRALTLSPELKLSKGQAETLLRRAGVEGSRRGETLTLDELDRLAHELARMERG